MSRISQVPIITEFIDTFIFCFLSIYIYIYFFFFSRTGGEITSQLVPIPDPVRTMLGRDSQATSELVFRALSVPALGYQSFYVSEKLDSIEETSRVDEQQPTASQSSIGGEVSRIGADMLINRFRGWHTTTLVCDVFQLYNITVNGEGKIVIRWKNRKNMSLEQAFHYYEGAEGDNKLFENRSSGAYIFRPKNSVVRDMKYVGSYKIYTGRIVQTYTLIASQLLRFDRFSLRSPGGRDSSNYKRVGQSGSSNLQGRRENRVRLGRWTDSN